MVTLPRVAINIVTYNSASCIDACLGGVFAQDYSNFIVTVIDNHSTDDTATRLRKWELRGVHVIYMERNVYYARAHNLAINHTESDLVLTLNPDVVIQPNYISSSLPAFEVSTRIGSVNGKLLLGDPRDGQAVGPMSRAVIDGAGLMMLKNRRPYLRGNRQPTDTSCLEPRYIFGADGACAMYRRSMLQDIAIDGECFDEDFVIYREDVDVAWRAQLYGWDCYYAPAAMGYHVRGFHLNQSRRSIPEFIRRQSIKNGWLLVIKNDTPRAVMHNLREIARYQARIVAGLLTIEHSSLPAIADVIRLWPRMRAKRTVIQTRRTRTDDELSSWFE